MFDYLKILIVFFEKYVEIDGFLEKPVGFDVIGDFSRAKAESYGVEALLDLRKARIYA